MELKTAFIQSVNEIFAMFQIRPQLQKEAEEPYLASEAEINALVSFNHSVQGNVVFGFDQSLVCQIASAMTGSEIQEINIAAKNAIGDLSKMMTDLALGKLKIVNTIYFAPPPTLITGENLFLLISRIKAKKLSFQLNEAFFSIAYSIES